MTMTVKLDAQLEQRLRLRSAVSGRPASEIIREALQAWLADTPDAASSAYELGADLFGRHGGAAELSSQRKQAVAGAWADKQGRRA